MKSVLTSEPRPFCREATSFLVAQGVECRLLNLLERIAFDKQSGAIQEGCRVIEAAMRSYGKRATNSAAESDGRAAILADIQRAKDRCLRGNLLYNPGDWFDMLYVERSYWQAGAAAGQIGDRRAEGLILSRLGNAWYRFGDAGKAEMCRKEALAIAEKLGDQELKGSLLEARGEACLKLGEVDKAKQFFAEALKIYDDLGSARADGVRQKLAKLPGE